MADGTAHYAEKVGDTQHYDCSKEYNVLRHCNKSLYSLWHFNAFFCINGLSLSLLICIMKKINLIGENVWFGLLGFMAYQPL